MESRMERKLSEHDCQIFQLNQKIDFFVRSSLPPKEGILFNGQIYDAHAIVSELIRRAEKG